MSCLQMAMQLIKAFNEIFTAKRLPLWLRPYDFVPLYEIHSFRIYKLNHHRYEIVATSSSTGFIEVVPDAVSVDAIKRRNPECPTLSAYFIRVRRSWITP